jgi:hypothetical protein
MLSKLMSSWGDSITEQKKLLNEELKGYFKYIKHEFISFKDVKITIYNIKLIGKYDMNKAAFLKADSRLVSKKEDLFKHQNVNKWEINQEDIKKIDKSELLRNKEYAFKYMMGKVLIFFINFFQ